MSNQVNSVAPLQAKSEASSSELHELGAEILDLFYTLTFLSEDDTTEDEVCHAFYEVLQKHWELCCLVTYLKENKRVVADAPLTQNAVHVNAELPDPRQATAATDALIDLAVARRCEVEIWLDARGTATLPDSTRMAPPTAMPEIERAKNSSDAKNFGDVQEATGEQKADALNAVEVKRAVEHLRRAELRAGLVVPVYVRDELIGALVVATKHPERLRAAARGVRLIAAPIVIAVAHARRTAAMRRQRAHIEHLVEELRERSDALEEANAELHRVARYRSQFLARMSHELRTPLTSILGFSEILLHHENLNESQQRFCEKIRVSGKQLQSSLDQLVDLSRLEAGHTEIFLHEFSAGELMRESIAAVELLAQKHEVTLRNETSEKLGSIVSDEGKLRQALYNFLAFAIGRSEAGESVTVTAERTGEDRLLIDICDTGALLSDPARLLDQFDLTIESQSALNVNEVGMMVAHRLIEALGGTVSLRARKECGLNVRLEVPVKQK